MHLQHLAVWASNLCQSDYLVTVSKAEPISAVLGFTKSLVHKNRFARSSKDAVQGNAERKTVADFALCADEPLWFVCLFVSFKLPYDVRHGMSCRPHPVF